MLCCSCQDDVWQVLIFQGIAIRLAVVALLIFFVVFEATHHIAQGHSRSIYTASTVVGGLCVGVLTVQGVMLLCTLQHVSKHRKLW